MEGQSENEYEPILYFERVGSLIHLPKQMYGIPRYFIISSIVIIIHFFVVDIIGYADVNVSRWLNNPLGEIAALSTWTYFIFAIYYIRKWFNSILKTIPEEMLPGFVKVKTILMNKNIFYFGLFLAFIINGLFIFADIEQNLIFSRGLMAGTINIIIWLFYIPILEAELFALLLGCIYSPISIMGKINLNQINPLEPDRCGGLKFIGRISLISPSVIFVGVSIGTLALLLRGYFDSSFLRWQIALIAVWVFGVILLIFPLPIVHKHLKGIKENELKKISDELKILRKKTAIEGKQDIDRKSVV